jgi:hypothetical protein
MTYTQLIAQCRKDKANGEILDFDAMGDAVSILSEYGWSDAIYADEHYDDPRNRPGYFDGV